MPSGLAGDIANKAAAVLDAQPGRTWVRLRTLSPQQYAEDGGGPPPGVYPVFVSLLKADIHPPDELAAVITGLTAAIALSCNRPPENVHILFQPPARGRIAFGGRLLDGE